MLSKNINIKIIAVIMTVCIEAVVFSFLYLVFVCPILLEPVYYSGVVLNVSGLQIYGVVGILLSAVYMYIELYYIFKRGYGH